MWLSRSAITVTISAPLSTVLAASAVLSQRSDSLSDRARRACGILTRPWRPPRHQTQAAAVARVERQHHVRQRAAADPLADLAQAAPASS
jgi:hypothetical protein